MNASPLMNNGLNLSDTRSRNKNIKFVNLGSNHILVVTIDELVNMGLKGIICFMLESPEVEQQFLLGYVRVCVSIGVGFASEEDLHYGPILSIKAIIGAVPADNFQKKSANAEREDKKSLISSGLNESEVCSAMLEPGTLMCDSLSTKTVHLFFVLTHEVIRGILISSTESYMETIRVVNTIVFTFHPGGNSSGTLSATQEKLRRNQSTIQQYKSDSILIIYASSVSHPPVGAIDSVASQYQLKCPKIYQISMVFLDVNKSRDGKVMCGAFCMPMMVQFVHFMNGLNLITCDQSEHMMGSTNKPISELLLCSKVACLGIMSPRHVKEAGNISLHIQLEVSNQVQAIKPMKEGCHVLLHLGGMLDERVGVLYIIDPSGSTTVVCLLAVKTNIY